MTRENYIHFDQPMIKLARAIDEFEGIQTVQVNEGKPNEQWIVFFTVAHNEHGWRALEFLAWIAQDYGLWIAASAPPPYLNEPGNCLCFWLRGAYGKQNKLANWINHLRKDYIAPEEN